ncbi:MAG: hypothetical protein OJF47_000440 [Nitrospira sp.]|jgi:putative transposase|nr:MAG: hypothetical protein OJF47_000440 [Nitrospira sp.]
MLSRFTEEKQIQILKEGRVEGIGRVCRKYRISVSTFYRWRAKHVAITLDPVRYLRSLQLENRRLKHRVAELSLDYTVLRSALVNDRGSEC